MIDLETYQKVAMYQCMAKSRWLGHLQCIFVKKNQYFQFSGSFFLQKRRYLKKMSEFFPEQLQEVES